MYIYKLGTECDGAQTRASDVYIPTLVALLGLCFDPSECFRDLRIWSRVVGNKSSVGGITVPSINCLWSPVWRLSACLESGIIYNILFNMQNLSKILLKLKLGNSKVLQITS